MTDIANVKIVFSAEGAQRVESQIRSIQSTSRMAWGQLDQIRQILLRLESKGLLGVEHQMNKTTSATKTLEMQIKKLESANAQLQEQMGKLKSGQQGVNTATKDGTTAVDKHGKGLRNLIPHVAAVTLSYMAMRKAVRAVMATLEAGADFEQQMAIVGGIVRATTAEFNTLSAAARKAGETTVWTATESANALRFLGMAGFNAVESVQALGGVLNLALIGELDLSRATDIATDTLRAFGLEAYEINRVVDVFVGTITRSNTNIEAMGQAMKFVAPVAAKLGYTIEEVSAMIGILSQSGIKQGIAGRALRMSFLKTMEAARSLGIESTNLIDVLKELESRHLGAAKLTETLKDLFGLRATPALLTLMQGMDQLEEFTEILNNARGETDKFIGRLNTTTVEFKKLASVIRDVAIEVFLEYADDLKGGLKGLAQIIKDNKDGIKDFFATIVDSGKIIGDVVVPSMWALGLAIKGWTLLTSEVGVGFPLKKFISGVKQLKEGVTALVEEWRILLNIIPEDFEGKAEFFGVIKPKVNALTVSVLELYEGFRKASEELGTFTMADFIQEQQTLTHATAAYSAVVSEFKKLPWYELLPTSEQQSDAIKRLKRIAVYTEQVTNELKERWGAFYDKDAEAFKEFVKAKVAEFTKADNELYSNKEKLMKADRDYSVKMGEELLKINDETYREIVKLQANLIFEVEAEKLNYVKAGSDEAVEIIKHGQKLALDVVKEGVKNQESAERDLLAAKKKLYKENVLDAVAAEREKFEAIKLYLGDSIDAIKIYEQTIANIRKKFMDSFFKDHDTVLEKMQAAQAKDLDETRKTEKQYRNDKLQAMKSLYDDLEEISGNYYEAQVQIIELEYEKYIELLDLKGRVYETATNKEKALFDALNRWKILKTAEQYQKLLIAQGGFFGGMKAYLIQAQIDWDNFYQNVGQLGYDTFENIAQAMEDSLTKVFMRDFDTIGDLWSELMDQMKADFARLIASLVTQLIVSGVAKALRVTLTSGGGAGAGAGAGAGGGGFWNYLLSGASSAYQIGTGESIGQSIVNSISSYFAAQEATVLASGGQLVAAPGMLAGSTLFGSTAGAYGGVGGMGAGSGGTALGGGVAIGGTAAAGIAAAAAAAIMIITAIFEHNMGGPTKLITESRLRISEDPDLIFQAEMYKAFASGGAYGEEDALTTMGSLAGMLKDSLDVYNSIFANLGDESKAAIKEALSGLDVENMRFDIYMEASEGAPISATLMQKTPGQISPHEWADDMMRALGAAIATRDAFDPIVMALKDAFGSEEARAAIVDSIKKNGSLTGEALADILGVSYEDLANTLRTEWSDGLKTLVDAINAAYAGGEEVLATSGSILHTMQAVFGKYFVDYIDEALENLKGSEMFAFMTDEIQDAINSIDPSLFAANIDAFAEQFTKNAAKIYKAGKVWDSLNAFIGRASNEITAYQRAMQEAQLAVTGYVAKMAEFGVEMTDEEIAAKTKEFLSAFTDGIDDLNASVRPLSELGQALAALNGQFDAYLDLLEKYGVDLDKITDLENMRIEAQERLLDEYKIYLGLIDGNAKTIAEIEERYKQFGLTNEQLIKGFKNATLEELKMYAAILGIDWTDIADDIGALMRAIGASGEDAIGKFEDAINSLIGFTSSLEEKIKDIANLPIPMKDPADELEDLYAKLAVAREAEAAQIKEITDLIAILTSEGLEGMPAIMDYFQNLLDNMKSLTSLTQDSIEDAIATLATHLDYYKGFSAFDKPIIDRITDVEGAAKSLSLSLDALFAALDKGISTDTIGDVRIAIEEVIKFTEEYIIELDKAIAWLESGQYQGPSANQQSMLDFFKAAKAYAELVKTLMEDLNKQLEDFVVVEGFEDPIARIKRILADIGAGDVESALAYLREELERLKNGGSATADEIAALLAQIKALEEATAAYIAMQEKQLIAMKIAMGLMTEEYGRNLRLEEIAERYKQFGMSFEEMIDYFKDISLEELKAIAKLLGIDWKDIAADIGFLIDALKRASEEIKSIIAAQRKLLGTTAAGDIRDIEKRYKLPSGTITAKYFADIVRKFTSMSAEEVQKWAEALGVSVAQLIADIMRLADIFGSIGISIEEAAKKIKELFQGVNDFINETGLAEKAERLWANLLKLGGPFITLMDYYQLYKDEYQTYKDEYQTFDDWFPIYMDKTDPEKFREIPPTPEELTNMSERLVEWFYAAEAAARELGQAELDAARLQLQVADRISSLIDQIDDTIKSIKYSALNVSLPYQKAEEAAEDYATLYAAALTGGPEDVSKYLGFASTYLQQQQADLKSSRAYQDLYASVMADMETIKGIAESGGYDAKILEELKKGNELTIEQTEAYKAAMVDVRAKWEIFSDWIGDWVTKLERVAGIIAVDWGDVENAADALKMLMELVSIYGWDNDIVLRFIADMGKWAAQDIERALYLIRQIPAGMWESTAVLTFVASLAANMLNLTDAKAVLDELVSKAPGGWDSKAVITFLANIPLDLFKTLEEKLAYLKYVGTEAGWGSEAYMTMLARFSDAGVPWGDIAAMMKEAGATDEEITKALQILFLNADANEWTWDEFMERWTLAGMADSYATKFLKLMYEGKMPGDVNTWSDYVLAFKLAGVPDAQAEKILTAVYNASTAQGLPTLWSDFEAAFEKYGWPDAEALKKIKAQYDGTTAFPTWDALNSALEDVGITADVLKRIKGQYDSGDMTWSELEALLAATGTPESVIREIKAKIDAEAAVKITELDVWIAQLRFLAGIAQNTKAISERLGGGYITVSELATGMSDAIIAIGGNWAVTTGTGVWPGATGGTQTVYLAGSALDYLSKLSTISSTLTSISQYQLLLVQNARSLNKGMGFPWYAEGGIATGPESGYPVMLHGTEAIVPLSSGAIPVQLINGGSTQEGAMERPLYITVEVAGKEFYADVQQISRVEADYVRVTANKTKGNETRRLYRN